MSALLLKLCVGALVVDLIGALLMIDLAPTVCDVFLAAALLKGLALMLHHDARRR